LPISSFFTIRRSTAASSAHMPTVTYVTVSISLTQTAHFMKRNNYKSTASPRPYLAFHQNWFHHIHHILSFALPRLTVCLSFRHLCRCLGFRRCQWC
jgi:hypothetical protein